MGTTNHSEDEEDDRSEVSKNSINVEDLYHSKIRKDLIRDG
jgi:hypothetical protein